METINKAAYWDYQRDRVYVKSRNKPPRKRKRLAIDRGMATPNTTKEHTRRSSCPKCESEQVYKHGNNPDGHRPTFQRSRNKALDYTSFYTTISLRSCKNTFYPLDPCRPTRKYGPNLIAYAVYLIIELRLSLERVTYHMRKLFRIPLWNDKIYKFKADTANAYHSVYDNILNNLCSGKLLHVDETTVSVGGTNGYVWVLTSMEEVA